MNQFPSVDLRDLPILSVSSITATVHPGPYHSDALAGTP